MPRDILDSFRIATEDPLLTGYWITMTQAQASEQSFIATLQALIGLLDWPPEDSLRQDAIALCASTDRATYRIAVFAPFNYGKSTLLNALLGQKTLPIGLIPTTGAAIAVRYAPQLNCEITLTNGQVLHSNGTEVLAEYATLDEQRRMRSDVQAVTVGCPHPFLQLGVEFLDLPGTNDRDAQEQLVRDRLLTADLIVQVLDARQVMTLAEREHLRDWLSDRGIRTVIFVVNFVNLLDLEEQQAVQKRLRFVAESFRADLPPSVNNLYRVDALPALRARLQGDAAAAQASGLVAFEAALQTIFAHHQDQQTSRTERIHAMARSLLSRAQTQQRELTAQLAAQDGQAQERRRILERAQVLIQDGFERDRAAFADWLRVTSLQAAYGLALTQALEQGDFDNWLKQALRPAVDQYRANLRQWVVKGCEFFQQPDPGDCAIAFPRVAAPPPPTSAGPNLIDEYIKTENFRWLLDVPVGGELLKSAKHWLVGSSRQISPDFYRQLAADYLRQFSQDAIAALQHYTAIATPVFRLPPPPPSHPETEQLRQKLALLSQYVDILKNRE